MRAKWIVCLKCQKQTKPSPALMEGGKVVKARDVGTTDQMRCAGCAGADGKATMCRTCCPTGHGTR